MPVCRFIFRIDYPTNFDIIDSPGEIMRTLHDAKKDLWQQMGEAAATHQISATYLSTDKKIYRQLNVEPNSIVIELESADGIPLRSFEEHIEVSTLFELVSTITGEYDIDTVARLGFRIFYFNKLADAHANIMAAYKELSGPRLGAVIEGSLGANNDIGLTFTGKGEDRVGYSFSSGPFRPEETPKFLGHIDHEVFKQSSDFNFICDLDLFDTKFSLAKTSPLKWCRSLFDKQERVINGIEQLIRDNSRN